MESGGLLTTVTNDIDGDVRPGPTGSVNGGASAPDLGADEFDGVPMPMAYVSSTTAGFGGYTAASFTNVRLLDVQVVTENSGLPLTMTQMTFTTTGTTLPADIAEARVYFTGTTSTFSTSAPFGSAVASPSGSFTITGSTPLAKGTNHFWLVYDITGSAPDGNLIDAECSGFTLGATPHVPTVTAPAEVLTILNHLSGSYTVGPGGFFPTLVTAFDAINAVGLEGNTELSIIGNQTLPSSAILNQWTEYNGSTYELTIKPAASITPTISGTVAGSLIQIYGADRVTIDGSNATGGTTRDMTIANLQASGTHSALTVSGTGTGMGSSHFTVKNCVLRAGHVASGAYVISIGGATPGVSGYDNDYFLVENNLLERGYFGIYAYGSNIGVNSNSQIRLNTIGSVTPASTITYKGIYVYGMDAGVIELNEVQGITMAYSGAIMGIDVASYSAGTIVRRNRVHGVINTSTSTSGYGAYGINISSTSGGTGIHVENNMVWDILNNGGGTIGTTYAPIGIRIAGGTGHSIWHNSVHLTGTCVSTTATGSMALAFTSSSYNAHDVRNNIFSNAISGATGSKSYAVWIPSSYVIGTTTFNNNDYWPSGAYALYGYNGTADVTTFNDWKTFTGQDGMSVSEDPQFTSATNLHINPVLAIGCESGGAAVGISIDIDGDVRPGPAGSVNGGAIAADMGADEFDGIPLQMTYVSSTTTGVSGLVAAGSTNSRIIGIEVVTSNPGNPLTMQQIVLGTTGTTNTADLVNAKIYYTGTSSTFAAVNQFGATYPAPSGAFTINGTQALARGTNHFWLTYDISASAATGNLIDAECTQLTVSAVAQTPTVTAPTDYLTVQAPLNGTVTVGVAGSYPTLKEAFDIINQVGLSGNLTLKIISDFTLAAPAVLQQWPEVPAASNYTLTIQPDGGALRTASYTPAAGEAAIRLAGADRVTIDGLNSGGNALTFANLGTSTNTGVIWLSSAGIGLGCTDVTLKNLTLDANGNAIVTAGIVAAGSVLAPTGSGEDNNNLLVQNCTITNAYVGVYVAGTDVGSITGLQILDNVIGTATAGIGMQGVYVVPAVSPLIRGNDVSGIPAGSGVTDQVGINIGPGVTGVLVQRNRVHDFFYNLNSGYGSNGIRYAADASVWGEISNNEIWNIKGDGDRITSTTYSFLPIGICIASGGKLNILYNSVYLTGTLNYPSTMGTSACMLVNENVTNMYVHNNIFQNSMDGTLGANNRTFGLGLQGTVATLTSFIDNNVYFVNGTSNVTPNVGYYVLGDAPTLADWRTMTGKDMHSASGDPQFVGPSNLAINATADPVSMASDLGVVVAPATDIDGNARSTSHPDAGAHEFAVTRTFGTPGTYTFSGGGVVDDLSITDPGAVVTLTGATTVGGSLTITGGQLDLGTRQLTLLGGLVKTGGTVVAGAGSMLDVQDWPTGPGSALFDAPALTLTNMEVNRAAGVILSGDVQVDGVLTQTRGNIRTGSNNLVIGTAGQISGTPSDTTMIVATGGGQLRKLMTGTGTFVFPMGDETGTPEYTPFAVQMTAGTFSAGAGVGVSLANAKHPNNTATTDYIARYWHVESNNITGFTCDVTGTYTVADVAGTEANLWTGKWDGAWAKFSAVNTGTHQILATGVTSFSDFTAAEDGIFSSLAFVVNAKAYLEGAWDGVSAMTTWLPSDPGFPLAQPYSGLPWSYSGTESVAAIPANVVDWVLVEVRDATLPSTIISRRAGFLLSDGTIVDTNGTSPLAFATGTAGSYHVAIWHRNHIPVMSAAAIPLTPTSPVYNFSTDQTQAYGFDPMKQLGTGVYGLVGGDATADQFIDGNDFNDADTNQWNSGYLLYDTNLDAFVDGNDFNIPDTNQWQGSQLP